MKKYLTSVFLLALVAAGCSRNEPQQKSTAAPVLVAKSFLTNVPVQIQPQPVGHVTAYSSVTVHSQIGGILSAVHFQEGDEVKSNALLFTIDPRPMEAALARDKAQLENAEAQFNRDKNLYEQKIESQDQFDTSKANLDALKATVQTDELNLSFTKIRAPFDGIVGALQKHRGDVIKAPDDTLVTINQIHPVYVQFAVPEHYLPEIQRQMKAGKLRAAVFFDGMTVPPPQGELTFVDNSVDTATGTIQLRATFSNEGNVLWPGQFVRVDLTVSEITNGVVVSSQAVQTGQNGEFIYVVKADDTVEERPIKIGISYDGMTVIDRGLKADETVVTDGQLRLAPGMKVAVKSPSAQDDTTSNTAPKSSPTNSLP
ncbi:MAG TPA: efflux RND transporter periplasmic adaptor subunit [Verrucomicrobiae bacterium]|nr:efflux RND transporter periplasmic adaptor subunit [Verrucomicrobiae bacterium]